MNNKFQKTELKGLSQDFDFYDGKDSKYEFSMSNITNNILRETVPNKNIRKYHLKTRVSNTGLEFCYRYRMGKEKFRSLIGENCSRLVDLVYNIHGIKDVKVEEYSISIEKAEAFNWEKDKIEDKIVELLKDYENKEGKVKNFDIFEMSVNDFKDKLSKIPNTLGEKKLLEILDLLK